MLPGCQRVVCTDTAEQSDHSQGHEGVLRSPCNVCPGTDIALFQMLGMCTNRPLFSFELMLFAGLEVSISSIAVDAC